MTITEALAEMKTLTKRITSKREYVTTYLLRIETLKDPLGDSKKALAEEMQAITDLETRLVDLRRAVNFQNDITTIEVEGVVKTISGWILWRRDVAPSRERFITQLRTKLTQARDQLRTQPMYATKEQTDKPLDMVVNLDEQALNKEAEQLKNILGQLDGQLSLKNATVEIKI